MRTLNKYKLLVHQILVEDRDARNSDKVLWHKVIKAICPEVAKMPFEKALMVKELPSYDSITRCRRRWQAKDPECMSDIQVARWRAAAEEQYREEYGRG